MERLIETPSKHFTRGNECPINKAGCQTVQNGNNSMDLNISSLNNSAKISCNLQLITSKISFVYDENLSGGRVAQ